MALSLVRGLIAIPLFALLLGARAQDSAVDDWDFATNPSQRLTVAAVQYSSGVLLRVECRDGQLALGVSGLDSVSFRGRRLDRTLSDGTIVPTYWEAARDGSSLVMNYPVRFVRSLKAGGPLILDTPAGTTLPIHIRLDLPSGSTGVDQVLTACGYASVDPRDQTPELDALLLQVPGLEVAGPAFHYRQGIQIEVSCLVADGRLSACQSDHEVPRDPEVGAATARAANGKTLRLTDVAAAEGRLVDVVVTTGRTRRRP